MPNFIDKKFDLAQANMTDIRAIVHALKMANLSCVEEDVSTEIRQLIKNLPSAEIINKMADRPEGLKDVRETVGYIMSLIDAYKQKDEAFKSRYQSRTNLPPRYKVLKWRNQMDKEAKGFIKELVKMSSIMDDQGDVKIASQLIKCAKAVRSEEVKEEDVSDLVSMLRKAGYEKESDFIKEAQVSSYLKGLWEKGKQNVGNMFGGMIDNARLEKTKAKINQIIQAIQPEMQYALEVAGKADEPYKSQLQGIANTLSQMATLGNTAIDSLGKTEQVASQQPQAQPQAQQPVADPNASEQAQADPQNPTAEVGRPMYYKNKPYKIQSDSLNNAFIEVPGEGKYLVISENGQFKLTPYDKAIPPANLGEKMKNVTPQPGTTPVNVPTVKDPKTNKQLPPVGPTTQSSRRIFNLKNSSK